MYGFLQVFCALFSAFLLAAAIPNEFFLFGSPILGLFANFPMYIAINRARTSKEAFWLCFLQGSTTHLLSSFWLGNFHGFALFTLGASYIGTGFLEAFISLFIYYPILIAKSNNKLSETANPESNRIPLRIIWFTSFYTIWEWVKSTGFLGYPWGTVSMTAYKWSFITQIADITGSYGITFLFTFASAIIGEGFLLLSKSVEFTSLRKSKVYLGTFRTFLALFALSFFYGAFEYLKPRTPIKTFNAVLVQQNGDPWVKGEDVSIGISKKLSEEKIEELKKQGKSCDLVVWSEAVLRKRFPNSKSYYRGFPEDEPLSEFISRMNVPFIIGGPVTMNIEKHRYSNSAILFNTDGEYCGSYQKMHLVPFAELIPFVEYDRVRELMKKMVGFSYGWYPGKCVTLFEIPISNKTDDLRKQKTISIVDGVKREIPELKKDSVKISTPICFDDTAAEVCRAMFLSGSEVFVNVTNDAWSQTNSAEIQHAVVAHYRAIEYRTTLARCTNAGYTIIVTPNGKIIDELPLFQETALATEIPVFERQITVYAKFGNWLPITLLLLALIYIFRNIIVEKESVLM